MGTRIVLQTIGYVAPTHLTLCMQYPPTHTNVVKPKMFVPVNTSAEASLVNEENNLACLYHHSVEATMELAGESSTIIAVSRGLKIALQRGLATLASIYVHECTRERGTYDSQTR